ncbi:hypothetical protein OGATHE_004929 [Ogataea polymorpha]|uniref:Uncharacterized protein n=1 Tax=Ogataea polymorpha TaxID=460523 RepID=A0A9P8NWQ2_9ASCO|nr:hypothetical protein OGATHE_004929 [Ogataea polymorpha]
MVGDLQGKHHQCNELRGVGFGGSHTNLRTSVYVDTAVGFSGNARTNRVDHTNGQGAGSAASFEGHHRICRLARLRNKDAVLFLKSILPLMVLKVESGCSKISFSMKWSYPPLIISASCISKVWTGLVVDIPAALAALWICNSPLSMWAMSSSSKNSTFLVCSMTDEASEDTKNSIGLLQSQERVRVTGSVGTLSCCGGVRNELDVHKVHLELLLALDTNQQRRTLPGGHQFVGIVDRLDHQTVGTLQLVQDFLGQLVKFQVVVLVEIVFEQLGDNFGVGVRSEGMALALQKRLELSIISDNTVVDHNELVSIVGGLWMAVCLSDSSVGGPSGVSDTHMICKRLRSVQVLRLDLILKVCNLANLLVHGNLLGGGGLVELLLTIDTNARRVVASVLKLGKPFDQRVNDLASGFADVVVGVPENATAPVRTLVLCLVLTTWFVKSEYN